MHADAVCGTPRENLRGSALCPAGLRRGPSTGFTFATLLVLVVAAAVPPSSAARATDAEPTTRLAEIDRHPSTPSPDTLSVGRAPFRDYNLPAESIGFRGYAGPILGVVGINVCLYWAPTRYIFREDFSYINRETIRDNLGSPFVVDIDDFGVNQIGHPYQGSNYFTTARAAGLGYWESLPYVFFGSLQWEIFMENEPPSSNDLITTTIGGQAVGEVLHRVSNLILDESTGGAERVYRETAAFVINPFGGVNRLVTGRMSARGPAPLRPPTDYRLSQTVGRFWRGDDLSVPESVTSFYMEYGSIYRLPSRIGPFEYFEMEFGRSVTNMELGAPGWIAYVNAIVAARKFSHPGGNSITFAAVQNYDYFSSKTNDVGAAAVGFGVFVTNQLGENMQSNWHINAVGLYGAVTNAYVSAHRDYNLGPGASVRSHFEVIHSSLGRAEMLNYRYWIRTTGHITGHDFAGFLRLGYTYPIWKSVGIVARAYWFDRIGTYDHLPNTSAHEWSIRLGVEWHP